MKSRFLIILSMIIIFVSSFAWSNPLTLPSPYYFDYLKRGHFFFQLGAFDAAQGKAQNIAIHGLIGDRFTVSKSHDQNVLLGLGYFFDGLQKDNYSLLYGVNAFYLGQTAVKGYVIQEQLFTNLSYRYYITHLPIYLSTKTYFHTIKDNYHFVVDLGLGPNIMMVKKFNEYAVAEYAYPDRAFSNRTNITLSASLGLGIQLKPIWRDMPVEITYRFFYLGQGSLDKNNSELASTLSTGTNYANALIISINT